MSVGGTGKVDDVVPTDVLRARRDDTRVIVYRIMDICIQNVQGCPASERYRIRHPG